jgi:hypothetical protein
MSKEDREVAPYGLVGPCGESVGQEPEDQAEFVLHDPDHHDASRMRASVDRPSLQDLGKVSCVEGDQDPVFLSSQLEHQWIIQTFERPVLIECQDVVAGLAEPASYHPPADVGV